MSASDEDVVTVAVARCGCVPGIHPIVVEARVTINGVVVFGAERWRCEAYLRLARGEQPAAVIEMIDVDPPVHTTVGEKNKKRLPWPCCREASS